MVAYSRVIDSLASNLQIFSPDTVSWVVKDVYQAGIPLTHLMVALVREHQDDLIGCRYYSYRPSGNDQKVRRALVQHLKAVSNTPPPPPEFVVIAIQLVATHQYKKGASALLSDIQSVPMDYFRRMSIPEDTLELIRAMDPALFSLLKARFRGGSTENARSYSAVVQSFHEALARFDLDQAEEEANRGGIPLANFLHVMRGQEGFENMVREFCGYMQPVIVAGSIPPPAGIVALAVRAFGEHHTQGNLELQQSFQGEASGGLTNYRELVNIFYQSLCSFNNEALQAMEELNKGWIPLTHLLQVMIEKGGYHLVIATICRYVQPMVLSKNMPPPAAFVAIAARALAEHEYTVGLSALLSDIESMPYNYFFKEDWIPDDTLRKIEGMDLALYSSLMKRFLGYRGIPQ